MNHHPEHALNVYLVGGAVRDRLLGFEKADRDWVVVGSNPDQMKALGFTQVGRDFPVFLHPVTHEEYALARLERKTKPGHQGFDFEYSSNVTLEEDLKRRDLTINAIAMNSQGQVIDPYYGQQDLKNKVLRHVSSAFQEDPLRVLRVARFATRFQNLGFTIAPETLDLMHTISQGPELQSLSAERIWREMSRTLTDSHPSLFFKILHEVGALSTLIPEWDCLSHDSFHSMTLCLDASALHYQTAEIRFASFMAPLSELKNKEILYTAFCNRIKPPSSFEKLAKLAIQYTQTLNEEIQSAQQYLELFNQIDAYRSPNRLSDLQAVCLSVAQVFHQAQAKELITRFNLIFQATQAITAKPFVDQGLTGLAIKQAIAQERLKVIQKIITQRFE